MSKAVAFEKGLGGGTGYQQVRRQGSGRYQIREAEKKIMFNDWTPADSSPASISPIVPNHFSGDPLLFYIQLCVLGRNDSPTSSRSGP